MRSAVSKEIPVADIKHVECKFVRYTPPPNGNDQLSDLHVIKEHVRLKDDTVEKRLRLIYDYERPYYIVDKHERNFRQRKEWIDIHRTTRFTARECDLMKELPRKIGEAYRTFFSLRQILNNPYIFGCTVSSRTELKHGYLSKYGDQFTPDHIFYADTETDVVNEETKGKIILESFAYEDQIYLCCYTPFFDGMMDVEEQIIEMGKKELPEYFCNDKWKISILLFDKRDKMVEFMFEKAHAYQPDTLTMWSAQFDMEVFENSIVDAGKEFKDVICDPSVPDEYKFFEFNPDRAFRSKEGGGRITRKREEQWHDWNFLASFQVVCMMRGYKFAIIPTKNDRVGLDAVLKRHGIAEKLKIGSTLPNGLDRHIDMQKNFKIEYCLYAIADSMRMVELDEKLKLLNITLPKNLGFSTLETYKSNPLALADISHYKAFESNWVYGNAGSNMDDDVDKIYGEILGNRENMILTLSPHQVVRGNGINCFKGLNLPSLMFLFVSDADLAAGYPTGAITYGLSRSTCRKEVIEVEGFTQYQQRLIGMLFTGGCVNAMEIGRHLYNLPSLSELDALYDDLQRNAVN